MWGLSSQMFSTRFQLPTGDLSVKLYQGTRPTIRSVRADWVPYFAGFDRSSSRLTVSGVLAPTAIEARRRCASFFILLERLVVGLNQRRMLRKYIRLHAYISVIRTHHCTNGTVC